MASRSSWSEICRSDRYRGRWVALDNVRYDPATSRPLEADVIDCDEDVGALCARIRATDRTSCAILHVDAPVTDGPALISRRRPSHPPSVAHH